VRLDHLLLVAGSRTTCRRHGRRGPCRSRHTSTWTLTISTKRKCGQSPSERCGLISKRRRIDSGFYSIRQATHSASQPWSRSSDDRARTCAPFPVIGDGRTKRDRMEVVRQTASRHPM
jgi:hypothetical protein